VSNLKYNSNLPQNLFIRLASGAIVIKLLAVVIYCHSIVILSFCVIKLYYLGNYCGMAVHYHGKKFYKNGSWWQTQILRKFTTVFQP
jgi:hypothetical protein